jgi:hypothetical protein
MTMKFSKTISMITAIVIGAIPASSVMANQYEDQIMYQLRAHQNSLRGYRMDDYEIGTLREGESYYLNANLNRGDEIVITGACDQDCRDIDLVIHDDRGRELDRDTLVDDQPVLNFVAPYSGDFEIEVVMYDCSTSYCYYGVALFSD